VKRRAAVLDERMRVDRGFRAGTLFVVGLQAKTGGAACVSGTGRGRGGRRGIPRPWR
jgi:hypothetical protein